jgi:signal transduction histidine kinase
MGLQLKDYISRQKQFISNVSHEIRTPLTAIKGYSEYLADEVGGDPEMDKVVFHLNNETSRLTNMVNDLLQLSRLDSLQENFTFSEVNLSQVLAETIEKMRNRANSHAIEFCTQIVEDIFVTGDRDKLIQVIVNILDNSIKYSPQEGKVMITLEDNDYEAQLIISDQGSGIPAEDIENVFDRFYRASNVNGINGTGLGLPISKEIIEKHKGSIKIENSDEGGTRVSILLPIKGKVLQH